jgi:hypothetical protein
VSPEIVWPQLNSDQLSGLLHHASDSGISDREYPLAVDSMLFPLI